jgi:hypothetical protein
MNVLMLWERRYGQHRLLAGTYSKCLLKLFPWLAKYIRCPEKAAIEAIR